MRRSKLGGRRGLGDLGAVVEDLAVTDRQHLALLWLLLGRVGDDDPSPGRLLLLDAANDETIVQRAYFHGVLLLHEYLPGGGAVTGTESPVFSPSTAWITSDVEAGGVTPRASLAVAASRTATAHSDMSPGQVGPPGITMTAQRVSSDATAAIMLTCRFDTKFMACLPSVR